MKKNIALVTGGFSGEAVISYKSAVTIDNNLDRNYFNVYKIDINSQGWFYELIDGRKIEIDKNDFSLQIDNQKIKFDAVFIGMHGTPGEDGKLQGYFDTLKIPYTGCDAATSAITFNKRYAVAVAGMAGIDVAKSVLLIKNSFGSLEEIISTLKFPVFIKPNNGGSSIGMSKVDKPADELAPAIEKAFKEDDQVLVEEMIKGREFTVGVFKSKGNIIVLPLTEVKADADKAFFDFEAKYQGKSTETTPAVVDEVMADKIRDAAKKIYTVFNCKGVVRIDFIYNELKGRPYMLEVNTIPGQSEASIVPQQVKVMGWSLSEFYTKLINECLET
ncbi:MAG: D-alanine--D-alanine ligase [Chitinophagaceae bacterium]|jgi:D-alanine-D-alanine ligase|nr:D-alanine--D-alanine ligase [Chitinophagaceae bacterium]MBK7679116.1 D-alanine--D-alanine ligase [Chitinophagaceae bacterium]MBK8299539.1 D-alanine--D-alanine ligase [Chitinophagaceae bacterium]MBK9463589.1 D-alanine--D-alanine ligase [Chitinophagaceae bacterium]MBK9659290.1 D-alanine--D-alanine ligase [Chitinophagaceae bacterium]